MIVLNIVGNLGADAEIKEITGRKYASFRIASTRRNREKKEETTWVSVLASYSENLMPYLKKGTCVFVSGEANISAYTTRDSRAGVDVSIFASSLALAGGRNGAGQENASQVGNNTPAPVETRENENNGELPF